MWAVYILQFHILSLFPPNGPEPESHRWIVNFTKLSIRRQDNSHHSINSMISTSYHLVASPPISWQKPSEALAWLAAWCPYSDRRWFVLIRFLLFPEGRLEDTELSQKFSPFFKVQRWSQKAGRAWSELHETAVINATTLPHLDLRRISFRFLRKFRLYPYFLQNQYLSLTDSTSKRSVRDLW